MNETPTLSPAPSAVERLPHEATRVVVEALGDEAPRALYRAYDEFNRKHFGGALGAPLVLLTETSGPRAKGDYIGRDIHGLRSRVRVAPSALARGERFAIDVLLHEMVHAWQSEVDGDTENGYRGHGPRFAAKCNEIGAKLGLPAVGVKGRKGLPDCAQWPVNVRPDGYYPPAPPKKRAGTKRREEGGGSPDEASRTPAGCLREVLGEAIALVEAMDDSTRRAAGLDAWLAEARKAVA